MANSLDLMRQRIVKSDMLNDYNTPNIYTSLQQKNMIIDKRKSLSRAIKYSYQGALVKKLDDELTYYALINPNKLKMDYDDKIISIGYEYDFKVGDTFEWVGTNSHWLIYLQDMTELAYFKGSIRKCSYEIKWKDGDRVLSTKVALRGPTETKINYIQKHEISIDQPNYSLYLLIPQNEDTLKFFQRYNKFYLQGDNTCWRIEAVDKYSTPGIIEVNAVEYYANDHQDDIEQGLVGSLIKESEEPNVKQEIQGKGFIKPKTTQIYEYIGYGEYEWVYDKKLPLKVVKDNKKITIIWTSSYSGQFELQYGPVKRTIVVESLF